MPKNRLLLDYKLTSFLWWETVHLTLQHSLKATQTNSSASKDLRLGQQDLVRNQLLF